MVYQETRRHSAHGITAAKIGELREVARRSARARRGFLVELWRPKKVGAVIWEPRALIKEQRRRGWGETGLTAHQSALAFEDAVAVVRGSWSRALANERLMVAQDPMLSPAEKHWLRFVMRSKAALTACLNREPVVIEASWAVGVDGHRLSMKLRRRLLRWRGRMPRLQNDSWFRADTNLYRVFSRTADRHFRGAWLALTGLHAGRRVCVPLAGRGLTEFVPRTAKANSRPHLRVVVGERVVFHVADRVSVPQRDGIQAGVDKGYRTLLTLSTGDPRAAQTFGTGANSMIAEIAEGASQRLKNRRRIAAYERSLRNSSASKARRIRRANLGRTTMTRRSRAEKARLRNSVNGGLNEMFRARPDIGKLIVEDLSRRPRVLSHRMNRRLGRWLRGYLQARLAYKSELNGVELQVVNAAFTSQMCPRCFYACRQNRRGDMFECRSCGYSGSADAVAATNVLARGSDPDITTFTRKERVKEILEVRWRSARSGRAWGSNAGDSHLIAQDEPRRTVDYVLRSTELHLGNRSFGGIADLEVLLGSEAKWSGEQRGRKSHQRRVVVPDVPVVEPTSK